MTEQQLAEIRARLAAVASSPWRIAYHAGQHDDDGAVIVGLDDELVTETVARNDRSWEQYHGEAELIANAPTDIGHLLAYVERLEGLLRDLCHDSPAAAEAVRLRKVVDHALRYARKFADVSAQCSALAGDIETLLGQGD